MFIWRLDAVRRVSIDDVTRYSVTVQWASTLKEQRTAGSTDA